MGADAGMWPHEANQMICDVVDLWVQIGTRHEVQRETRISNVSKDLKNGDVFFEPIYRYIEESSATEPRWEKVGI